MAFDPAAATAAMIDSLGADALAKAATYTVGNHWMLLWGLLVSAAVTWLAVRLRVTERVSHWLRNRGWALRTWLVCAAFLLFSAIVSLPWGIYEEWGRETAYGRTDQPMADFLMQDAIGIALTAVFGALFFLGIYALIRRTGRRWWLWSGGLAAASITAVLILSPIAIEPLFNDYQPIPEGPGAQRDAGHGGRGRHPARPVVRL